MTIAQDDKLAGSSPDPTRAGELAQQIVSLLKNEDEIMRRRTIQVVMTLLGDASPQTDSEVLDKVDSRGESQDLASFFNHGGDMKPADCAYLCAAYHFSNYGPGPFSIAEIRTIAGDAGVIVPDRLDMTFGAATKNGKKLFLSAGKGQFKPTAAGSMEFASRWNVRPGRNTKNAQNQ